MTDIPIAVLDQLVRQQEEIERLQRICNKHGTGGLRTEIERLRKIEAAAKNLVAQKDWSKVEAYKQLEETLK